MEESKKPSKKNVEKEFVWTREMIKDVEDFIEHLADRYLTYKRDEAEATQKYLEATAKHNRRMTVTLVLFLTAIVMGMSYLTLNGRVSGDALLFLVGTITGYVLLFIQRLILTTREVSAEREILPEEV